MLIIKCKLCRKDKAEDDFDSFRGRKNKSCKECRKKNNEWYSSDKDGRKSKAKSYYRRIKNKIAQYRSDLRLDRKYSMTRQEWTDMLARQNNRCPICETDFIGKSPCVDHDHKTGKVRSLLCRRCNLDLQVVENIGFMEKAQSYLDSMK